MSSYLFHPNKFSAEQICADKVLSFTWSHNLEKLSIQWQERDL